MDVGYEQRLVMLVATGRDGINGGCFVDGKIVMGLGGCCGELLGMVVNEGGC